MDQLPEELKIKTSSQALLFRVICSALLILVACVITTLFFESFGFGTNFGKFLIATLWILSLLAFAISTALIYRRNERSSYIITGEAVFINKASVFNLTTEFYNYDSFVKVQIWSNLTGRLFDCDNVVIDVSNSTKKVVLKEVARPEIVAKEIRRRAKL